MRLPSKVRMALNKKTLTDRYMRFVIEGHIKEHYYKKGITPTTNQVMQNISSDKLNLLCQQGYTEDEIKTMVEETIRRSK